MTLLDDLCRYAQVEYLSSLHEIASRPYIRHWASHTQLEQYPAQEWIEAAAYLLGENGLLTAENARALLIRKGNIANL